MDYEKRYNDALRRAKKLYEQGTITESIGWVFPELEDENERMKREILELVSIAGNGNQFEEIKDWLEKYGEQPTDKVEPKFHEGEWLCENEPNNYARFIQILETVNVQGKERYRISRDIHNDEDTVEFDFVEKYYHKFSIQDVRDGDVLVASDGSIFLFAGVDDCACKYYVALTTDNHVEINKGAKGGYWETSRAVYPATKEQRDLLFQKMADEGYEWDSEKKELKKIESKALDPDKVVEWLECKAFQGWAEEINIKQIVDKFKKDFEL